MSWRRFLSAGLWASAMTILLGAGMTQAASTSAKPADESRQAARMLQEIKNDAMQVQSAATRLNGLTATAGATWLDYDQQWNEIKPAQEDMQIKLWRLESMQAKLSTAERAELDQIKPVIAEIQVRTHELRTLLDKPGVQTSDRMFKTYATSLRSEAGKLAHTAAAS